MKRTSILILSLLVSILGFAQGQEEAYSTMSTTKVETEVSVTDPEMDATQADILAEYHRGLSSSTLGLSCPTSAHQTLLGNPLTTPAAMAADYHDNARWQKGKRQRKIGWLMFGGGVGAFVVGYGCLIGLYGSDMSGMGADILTGFGVALAYAGGASYIASFPVLLTGLVNRCAGKRQTRRLNAGITTLSAPTYTGPRTASPGLSLSYSF